MNREEEKMLLQNEKAMMNQLKKDLEQEEVPLGVYPSMMKEKLKQQTEQPLEGATKKAKKRGNFYKRMGVVLGAVLVLLISGIILEVSTTNWFSTGSNGVYEGEIAVYPTDEKTAKAEEATKENQNDQTENVVTEGKVTMAESYEQLFEMFKEQGKVIDPSEHLVYDYEYVMEDAAAVITESTTDGASDMVTNGSGMASAETSSKNGYYAESSESEGDASPDDVSQTNVQEQGVDEGDIIKTDGEYIYILQENENAIRVVKANGGEMEECDNYLLPKGTTQEMYVSEKVITVITQYNETRYYDLNGKELTEEEAKKRQEQISKNYENALVDALKDAVDVLYNNYHAVSKPYITIESLRVKEDGTLESLGTITQDGSYHSSRKVDGIVYLFTQFNTQIYDGTGDIVEEYIPRINGECIPADCIAVPESLDSDVYVVCSSFEAANPDNILQQLSVLTNGYSETLYVSENSIYITNTEYFWEDTEEWDCRTEITKFNYNEGVMSPQGHVFVSGMLLNSFSLNEHNGYLRLVTSGTRKELNSYVMYYKGAVAKREETPFEGSEPVYDYIQSNQLYVINENMELVGRIEGIAKDESIQSARFMGDVGYFVTYKNVDPLFSVDLSDPTNPKIMDALKIPGFSSYLHFYSNELLLGIGQETDPDTGVFLGLKLSMFDISDPYNVQEANKYVIEDGAKAIGGEGNVVAYSEALYNHKAVLINPERNILGFPIELGGQWDSETEIYTQECRYVIFGYGEEGFYNTFTFGQECDRMRGVYIGNTLYICAWDNEEGEVITAFDMSANYAKVGELVLEKEYTEEQVMHSCVVLE